MNQNTKQIPCLSKPNEHYSVSGDIKLWYSVSLLPLRTKSQQIMKY